MNFNKTIVNIRSFFRSIKNTQIDIFFIICNLRFIFYRIFKFNLSGARIFRIISMINILTCRYPFKIFNLIIRFNKILMINFRIIIRIWYIIFSNKTRNKIQFFINNTFKITLFINNWFQKNTSTNRINPTIGINNIVGVNMFHNTNVTI